MEQIAKLREIAESSGTVAEFVFDLIKILEENRSCQADCRAI